VSENDEYKVGYRKPPKASRWRKGQSGNRSGRKNGVRNLKTDLTSLLNQKIPVRENGKVRYISRQEALLLSLCNKGLHGDVKASTAITTMVAKFDPPATAPREDDDVSDSDRAIMDDFLRRNAPKGGGENE
jgi:hypothetical protein